MTIRYIKRLPGAEMQANYSFEGIHYIEIATEDRIYYFEDGRLVDVEIF